MGAAAFIILVALLGILDVVTPVSGKPACSTVCQQGKIIYPDGNCTCICKKNFVKINDTSCARALWSRWSPWTKCLQSDWGGVQTRNRICKSGTKGAPGSCDGRGSISRTCSPIKKEFRIRKNMKDLTDEEIHDIVQAMTKFKNDSSNMGYRYIVSWHGWPGICTWYQYMSEKNDGHCSWHHHPLFLSWHRLFTVQLELGLSRYMKNKTLGIPFWDWTDEEYRDIPLLIRNPEIYDPVLKTYVHNPFHKSFIKYIDGKPMYSQRRLNYTGLLMAKYHLKGTVRGLLRHNYNALDDQLETNPHDEIHRCMCHQKGPQKLPDSLCFYGMPDTFYAAWDPAFFFHHSAVDRLFVMRRKLEESAEVSDWTENRIIGKYLELTPNATSDISDAFDWPLSPFCNKSINPQPVTKKDGVWRMRNAYYGEELFGYRYADLNSGGKYDWNDLVQDFKRNAKDGDFWIDDIIHTKLGQLTKKNSLELKKSHGCAIAYSNPEWNVTIVPTGNIEQ